MSTRKFINPQLRSVLRSAMTQTHTHSCVRAQCRVRYVFVRHIAYCPVFAEPPPPPWPAPSTHMFDIIDKNHQQTIALLAPNNMSVSFYLYPIEFAVFVCVCVSVLLCVCVCVFVPTCHTRQIKSNRRWFDVARLTRRRRAVRDPR